MVHRFLFRCQVVWENYLDFQQLWTCSTLPCIKEMVLVISSGVAEIFKFNFFLLFCGSIVKQPSNPLKIPCYCSAYSGWNKPWNQVCLICKSVREKRMITRRDFDLSIDLAVPAQSTAKPCCALAWPQSCYAAGMQSLSLQPLLTSMQTSSPDSACSAGCMPIQHAAPLLHWRSVSAGVMV